MFNFIKTVSKKDIRIYALFSLLLITFFIYFNSLNNQFINLDDNIYVYKNEILQKPFWQAVKYFFTYSYPAHYQPITMTLYKIIYQIAGLNPFYFHLFSLIFHLLTIIIIFLIFEILLNNLLIVWIVTLLFALHPLNVESVAWISKFNSLLFPFFYLAALLSYLIFLKDKRTFYYFLAIVLFVFSLLSKSGAVSFPIVLLIFDYYYQKTLKFKDILTKLPFFLISIFFGLIAVFAARERGTLDMPGYNYYFIDRLFIASYALIYYIVNFLFPHNLSVFHLKPSKIDGYLPPIYYAAAIIIVLLIFILPAIAYQKRKKNFLYGLAFYIVSISIYLQIIPVGRTIVAERYAYLPIVGLLWCLGTILNYFFEKKYLIINKTIFIIIIIMCIYFAYKTYTRTLVWQNSISLFSDIIQKSPDAYYGYYCRANIKSENRDFQSAIIDFNKAIRLNPYYDRAYYQRGVVYYKTGKLDSALLDMNSTISLNPDFAEAYNLRGLVLSLKKNYKQALRDFNKTIVLNPKYKEAYNNRANVYVFLKKYQNALKDYKKVICFDSLNAEAYFNCGSAYFKLDSIVMAKKYWQKAAVLGYTKAKKMLNKNKE